MQGKAVELSLLLALLTVLLAKTPRAYDYSDIDEDIMPPAPRGEPFQETESDAMKYILDDNDPIEKEIAEGHLGHILIDGDILNPEVNETSRNKRNVVRERSKLWPGGLVPYVIDSYFHIDSKLAILSAMQRFHDKTCIRFRPRTIERDFIYIGPGRGCWSLVGRQGSRQSLSLGSTCKTKRGTIMHELMHVLGFRHEHNRPDRDAHVIIYWENIAKPMKDNFKKYHFSTVNLLGVGYDFGSIMHYPMYAFSKNGAATLSPRYTTYQEIGYRNDFSDLDIFRINTLYKCGACQDTDHNHCPTWAMGGSCERNRDWMAKNCAFSCMMCKTNSYGACTDNHSSCKAWAKIGECRRNPSWMKETCPLSCGGCPLELRNRRDEIAGCHDKNTLCYDWALIGECHANKGFMSKMCRLSCIFCNDREIAETGREPEGYCHDWSTLCHDWSTLGECTRNPGYMNKRCKYSCQTCKASDKRSHAWTFLGEKACKNRHPSCTIWAKHGLCESYSTWMFPNCPHSCKKCPSNRDRTNDHLRPTLSSEEKGNTFENLTGIIPELPTVNTSSGNWTIPDIEVQPILQALQPLEVEVVQATEPPMEILQNNDTEDQCHDRDGRCIVWADEGRCRKPNRFMFDYCRYSCQLCDVDEFQLKDVCRDIHGFCSIYAKEGECEANEEWMGIYCKKSCGFCKRSALTIEEPAAVACGDRSTRCTLMVARGDCEKARARMKTACPKSCGFCGKRNKEDCRDRNKRCKKWAKTGECAKYTTWMRVNCPLSCDTCDALTYNRGCLDTYRKCPTWAAAGECESSAEWMKTNCRFSCESCDYTIQNPGCSDRYKRCKIQAEAGACTDKSSAKWMSKHCRRSCNLCDDEAPVIESADGTALTGECRDRNPFCPKWAESNMCVYNPSVMRVECKESCNLCPKIPDCHDKHDTKTCKRWAWLGECLTNPEGTKPLCKKSCGWCGEREGCKDLNRRCIRWAREGYCEKSGKFMRKFCAPSCGICTPDPEENENVLGGEQGARETRPAKKKTKKPARATPEPPTTVTPTTRAPEPVQERPNKKKSKKANQKKKNKKNKNKKNKRTKTQTATRQLRPDSQLADSAIRTSPRQLPAWKIARLKKRLELAEAQTRAQQEAKEQRLAAKRAESGEVVTGSLNGQGEQVILTEQGGYKEKVNPTVEDLQLETATLTDLQDHGETTDTL